MLQALRKMGHTPQTYLVFESLRVGKGGVSLADFLSVPAGHWFDKA